MPQTMINLLEQYIMEVKKIYGGHLCKVIFYGIADTGGHDGYFISWFKKRYCW